jgi:hypothetical protein
MPLQSMGCPDVARKKKKTLLSRQQKNDRDYMYRDASLVRNCPHVGPYSSPMSRDLW